MKNLTFMLLIFGYLNAYSFHLDEGRYDCEVSWSDSDGDTEISQDNIDVEYLNETLLIKEKFLMNSESTVPFIALPRSKVTKVKETYSLHGHEYIALQSINFKKSKLKTKYTLFSGGYGGQSKVSLSIRKHKDSKGFSINLKTKDAVNKYSSSSKYYCR